MEGTDIPNGRWIDGRTYIPLKGLIFNLMKSRESREIIYFTDTRKGPNEQRQPMVLMVLPEDL